MTLLGYIIINIKEIDQTKALDQKVNVVARFLEFNGEKFIWDFDNASLDLIAKSATEDLDIDYVTFYDTKNKQLTQKTETKFDYQIFEKKVPVLRKDKEIGSMVVGYNKNSIKKNLKDSAYTISAIVIVAQLLISISLFFIIRGVSKLILSVLGELKDAAIKTNQNSDDLKAASEAVASATTEQASAIQETVSTLDEITAMIDKSVQYAQDSNTKSNECSKITNQSRDTINNMISTIEDISQSNDQAMTDIQANNEKITEMTEIIKKISTKTSVINDIVFQTKLLAFNASVEAARAGEHGKGFSVVAEEVGNLAEISGTAANEIEEMLTESVVKVEEVVNTIKSKIDSLSTTSREKINSGVVIAKSSGELLEGVVTNVLEVQNMLEGISSASEEQSTGVRNITTAMREIDNSNNINTDIAQKTATSSHELATQADQLLTSVAKLEDQIYGANSKRRNSVPKHKATDFQKDEESVAKDLENEFDDDSNWAS